MTKESKKKVVDAEDKSLNAQNKTVDYVDLIRGSVQAQGMSSFIRVNLEQEVSSEGLKQLNEEYSKQGYEVFANSQSVLLLKQ